MASGCNTGEGWQKKNWRGKRKRRGTGKWDQKKTKQGWRIEKQRKRNKENKRCTPVFSYGM